MWRFEDDERSWYSYDFPIMGGKTFSRHYLSRVQYKSSWHIQLQWPLFLEVQVGGWEAYVGFKRDADKVYWVAAYAGRTWK
jgi:hypothetical protein